MESDRPSSTIAEWKLRNAQVVGVLKKGGVIVENGIDLDICEGRRWSALGDLDDPAHKERLHYEFTFEGSGDGPPEHMNSMWGKIVITGEGEEDERLMIQGNGWIGYDEYGRPQGNFLKPPKIKVVIGEDNAASMKRWAAEQWERSPANPKNTATIQ